MVTLIVGPSKILASNPDIHPDVSCHLKSEVFVEWARFGIQISGVQVSFSTDNSQTLSNW